MKLTLLSEQLAARRRLLLDSARAEILTSTVLYSLTYARGKLW